MKKTILFTFFLGCCILNQSVAHPGGHYRQTDFFNSWQLADGNIILGNFSKAQNGMLFLEQADGKFVTIPINRLSRQDQKLASFKIEKLANLNTIHPTQLAPIKTLDSSPYSYFLITLSIIGVSFLGIYVLKKPVTSLQIRNLSFVFLALIFVSFAFQRNTDVIIPKTKPSFIDAAFSPYKPQISTSWDENNFYVSSNGIPNHNMMVGIKNWQQQVPVPQSYTGSNSWTIPLQPVYAANPLNTKTNFMRGAIAIAVNGIPIFNALNNRGEDAYLIGELDQWGGHCGKGDDYHYHVAPLSLREQSGLKPIAFALDGFAVYGDKESDGSEMKALDSCHGHQDANGVYHYHGTKTYPYVIGAMRGEVKMDDVKLAPENQILPQAFTSPLRPPTKPLRGAIITDFKKVTDHSYALTYEMAGNKGFINYSWDNQNNYTFQTIDPSGQESTAIYTKKIRPPKK